MTKKILLLDTETSLKRGQVFDLGFMVIDVKTMDVVETGSYVISNTLEKDLPYFSEKVSQYWKDIRAKKHEFVSYKTAVRAMESVIVKHNIKEVYAYNANFDVTHINSTADAFGVNNDIFNTLKVKCLWNMACQYICNTPRYRRFAIANGFVSNAGNIQTGAEIVYRYLTNNVDFVEEHTALEDCDIERQIFIELKRKRAKALGIDSKCWKYAQ